MTPEKFEEIVNSRLTYCKKLLVEKGKEYSRNGDRLWNFKLASKIASNTPEMALKGMLIKHWVSILDMIDNPSAVTPVMINDKLSDNINYTLLLEGLFIERMDRPGTGMADHTTSKLQHEWDEAAKRTKGLKN